MTRYGFRQALGAFFLAEKGRVQDLLPPGLVPLEARPAHAVISITAFDFIESEVGRYGEIVLSTLVPPFAPLGHPLPQASMFPIALATTTPASRAHARERWHLPEFERCLDIEFSSHGHRQALFVHDEGKLVLSLEVERRRPVRASRLYQVFSLNERRLYRVNLEISGHLDEHQEETGRLEWHDHAWTNRVLGAVLEDSPIAEQSMEAGEQRFAELVLHDKEQR